jgi:hypothetical protein|tara:strand:+ start:3331 stop:3621 length:291 start_codon:yes stop_codon:yes gene_type:complete
MRNRCYFSKAGFEEMRLKIEEYVKSRGTVTRDEIIQKFKYRGLPMNNRQLGYLIGYSENKGVLTSFTWHTGTLKYDTTYFITTVERFYKFIGEKNG